MKWNRSGFLYGHIGPLIEKYRLRTKHEWKKIWVIPMWAARSIQWNCIWEWKQSRLNAQNYLGAIESTNSLLNGEKHFGDGNKGNCKWKTLHYSSQIRDADPRFEYYDFDFSANARELYFFQFTLTGMTFLQRWGDGLDLKMPFDYFKCVQFMNDFLIQEAFMGGWMESRAINELNSTSELAFRLENCEISQIIRWTRCADLSGIMWMVTPSPMIQSNREIQVKPYWREGVNWNYGLHGCRGPHSSEALFMDSPK